MNLSNDAETALLKLYFQNVAIAGIGDASGILGSAVAGNLYFRLCTDAVTVTDAVLGTECAYTGYVAKGIAVARGTAKWDVTDDVLSNIDEMLWGKRTDAGATETWKYIEVWKNNTSSVIADRCFWFELNTPVAINENTVPKIAAGNFTLAAA